MRGDLSRALISTTATVLRSTSRWQRRWKGTARRTAVRVLKPQYRYYDYEFERYWHFFQVFGRLGYNPNTPVEVWDREFERHFGKAAGPLVESALHRASWILPRIVASSYPYHGFPMTAGWAEKQHLGDLATFAKAEGSDVTQFENFDEESQRLIDGGKRPRSARKRRAAGSPRRLSMF